MSLLKKNVPVLKQFVRYRATRRNLGKPPGVAKNLEQRLAELHYKDPSIHYRVDIGFSVAAVKRKDILKERVAVFKENKNDPKLENLSRNNKLVIPLEEVEHEWNDSEYGKKQIRNAADHYGVFRDLYGDAYFTPALPLSIDYSDADGKPCPVYRGNIVLPSEAKGLPKVQYKSNEDSLWTLALTSPDGHLTSPTGEYALWLKCNIKGNNVKDTGEEVFSYLQPFPLKGIGYCRYVFVLYHQSQPLDISSLKKTTSKGNDRIDPEERNFSTQEFYRERQDILTPAGLAFFQSSWDESVTELFHDRFQRPSPEFEYDFPPHFYAPQKWFPLKQPFNLYLDRYREEKDIAQEWLKKKLKATHPFKAPSPPLPFPYAIPIPHKVPSWLKNEIKKERLGWARAADYK